MSLSNKISKIIKSAMEIGFIHLLSANLLIQIAGFGGQIFLTRILNVEEIGTIKVLQSHLNILVVIASLGLNTAVLKLASEDISKREQTSIFNISFLLTIISSFILIAVVYYFNIFKVFKVYVFLLPILCITSLIIVYLQSQQRIQMISYVQSYSKILIVGLSTLFAYLFGLNGYLKSLIILNFIAFIFIIPFIRNELKSIFKFRISNVKLKKVWNIAFFALGANLLGVLLSNLNIIMANSLLDNISEIGFYSIAQLIITTMMMIPSTLGQIMVPKISKVSNNIEEVKMIYKTYQFRNTILALSVAISAGILAPFIIPIVFGSQYEKSVLYFEILLIGFICWSIYSPKGMTLMSLGKSNINFYVSLCSFTLNVILNYILIKNFEMIGGAIANSLVYFITIFINAFLFKKVMKRK
ncbi:oligosaccharide flippase family protein [Bacillus sp. B4EP4a]|uniref:oligosaccharide flippase family protein n=2 Tax=Bacillus sp. B4EP4a TaxID=2590665 RepID=UPI001153891F|nr:oligosaccharide flippase family protein [Bacillus sp. B4EP4a]